MQKKLELDPQGPDTYPTSTNRAISAMLVFCSAVDLHFSSYVSVKVRSIRSDNTVQSIQSGLKQANFHDSEMKTGSLSVLLLSTEYCRGKKRR